MRHADFTKYFIQSSDLPGVNFLVARIPARQWTCEHCGVAPAEYRITSEFDTHGFDSFYACQEYMMYQANNEFGGSPDTFTIIDEVGVYI